MQAIVIRSSLIISEWVIPKNLRITDAPGLEWNGIQPLLNFPLPKRQKGCSEEKTNKLTNNQQLPTNNFYFMSSQYNMREFLLTGLISGRYNLDNIAGTFNTAAVCFKTYFIIAC